MKAFIILNSDLPPASTYITQLRQADLILCADGGANRALDAGIQPDYVVGDLDSITEANRRKLPAAALIIRPSQYATDLEKTLDFALEKGCTSATVIGIKGRRLDHQICNLNILEKYSARLDILTIDDTGMGCFVRERFQFDGVIGQQVSIFAFRRAEGITLQGLKYPLREATMEWAVNDGLSNEVVANPVIITVRSGTLFLYRVWPNVNSGGHIA